MGFGLGLVIGLVLVSLAEALDTRIRHSDEVVQWLGLPLLTRIPIPPRQLRKAGSLGMLDDEGGLQTEAYRKLRINLDFANLSIKARTIMVTSASRAGGQVDDRRQPRRRSGPRRPAGGARRPRPAQALPRPLLRPHRPPGLTDVALGNVTLDQALWSIPVPGSDGGPQAGSLHVLPSGPMPPNPADLIESSVVSEVLLDLAERADVVLLDSAPLLPVSDGVVLSNKVDAMLIVVRATTVKRPVLAELQRVLSVVPGGEARLRPDRLRRGRGLRLRVWIRRLRLLDARAGAARRAGRPGDRPLRQRRRERAGAAAVAHAVALARLRDDSGVRQRSQRVAAPERRWPPAFAGGHREVQLPACPVGPGTRTNAGRRAARAGLHRSCRCRPRHTAPDRLR